MANTSMSFTQKYFLISVVTIILVLAAVFLAHQSRIETLTEHILHQQAKALYKELVMTRKWVNSHGGAYVKVRPGVEPHPLLSSMGVKVNIETVDGEQYTLINPAIAVRQISEISEQEGDFKLHVASLNPVGPNSRKPDAFEEKALHAFEKGVEEYFAIEKGSSETVYRYMAPVKFQERCNKCHAFLNLKPGDIRGGISVSIPMTSVQKQLKESRIMSGFSAVVVLSTLLGLLTLISRKFIARIHFAQEELKLLAATDRLTGLYNRGSAFERLKEELAKGQRFNKPLSCLLFDVDHFKSVNDQYGHLVGDKALQHIAKQLQSVSREYDIVCRYGGEEFLIILPETDSIAAATVAEKYRQIIEEQNFSSEKGDICLTVSIGVTTAKPEDDKTPDSLVSQADSALYQAKEAGRNQTIQHQSD